MDIHTAFFGSLSSKPILQNGIKTDGLLGEIYKFPKNIPNHLFTVAAGGKISCSSPFFYDFKYFGYYMLLYTESGCGQLSNKKTTVKLNKGTFVFFNCRQPFKLCIAEPSWKFTVFFFNGPCLQNYYEYAFSKVLSAKYCPEIEKYFNLLLHNKKSPEIQNKFLDNCYITNILTVLCVFRHTPDYANASVPNYVTKVKNSFDKFYFKDFSLQYFEETLGISKYTLCHEFTKHFGVSPIHYLTGKRIDAAKKMLLTTNMEVHEIGSAVGIKNTNHFINLFKKYTGKTPLVFRQTASGDIVTSG